MPLEGPKIALGPAAAGPINLGRAVAGPINLGSYCHHLILGDSPKFIFFSQKNKNKKIKIKIIIKNKK
jgi:hypothetical protein